MQPEPALIARHLEHSFGTGEAAACVLRGRVAELHRGQVLLLMGLPAAASPLLLAVLAGLLRPDRGEVMVLGEDLWRMSERGRERFRLRHFGFVFQGFNLFPSLTAREQLEMVVRWGEGALAYRRPVAALPRCSTNWGWAAAPTCAPTGSPAAKNSVWPWGVPC